MKVTITKYAPTQQIKALCLYNVPNLDRCFEGITICILGESEEADLILSGLNDSLCIPLCIPLKDISYSELLYNIIDIIIFLLSDRK